MLCGALEIKNMAIDSQSPDSPERIEGAVRAEAEAEGRGGHPGFAPERGLVASRQTELVPVAVHPGGGGSVRGRLLADN